MSAQAPAQKARHKSKIISVAVPDINDFVPGHTEGDTDFDGNGPSVYISADVKRKGSQLVLAIYAIFQETESDWTTFGSSSFAEFLGSHRYRSVF